MNGNKQPTKKEQSWATKAHKYQGKSMNPELVLNVLFAILAGNIIGAVLIMNLGHRLFGN